MGRPFSHGEFVVSRKHGKRARTCRTPPGILPGVAGHAIQSIVRRAWRQDANRHAAIRSRCRLLTMASMPCGKVGREGSGYEEVGWGTRSGRACCRNATTKSRQTRFGQAGLYINPPPAASQHELEGFGDNSASSPSTFRSVGDLYLLSHSTHWRHSLGPSHHPDQGWMGLDPVVRIHLGVRRSRTIPML